MKKVIFYLVVPSRDFVSILDKCDSAQEAALRLKLFNRALSLDNNPPKDACICTNECPTYFKCGKVFVNGKLNENKNNSTIH